MYGDRKQKQVYARCRGALGGCGASGADPPPSWLLFFPTQLKYEVRKTVHLLFIPFMVAVCFHGRLLRLLGGVLLAWYLADRLYFTTKMTFLVSSPSYKSVGRGALVRFDLPE